MNKFGKASLSELQGVHIELAVATVETLTFVYQSSGLDFSVFDGVRTPAEQQRNIRRGVSWTMNSLHLPQADGYAWAVDLVPYINGRLLWEGRDDQEQVMVDKCFHLINEGMMASAARHGFDLDWGYDLWGKDMPHFQRRAV